MSLIRGFKGARPCPVCLVPTEELTNVEKTFERRTAKIAQDIVWDRSLNLGQKEALLKPQGLRNVEVCSQLSRRAFFES